MTQFKLERTTQSYVMRLHGTRDAADWHWRIVLTTLGQADNQDIGFQTIDELAQFLCNQIDHLEKNDEQPI